MNISISLQTYLMRVFNRENNRLVYYLADRFDIDIFRE